MKKYTELNRNNLREIAFLNKELSEVKSQFPDTPIFEDEEGNRVIYVHLDQDQKELMDNTITKQYEVMFQAKLIKAEILAKRNSGECEIICDEVSNTVVVFFNDDLIAYDIFYYDNSEDFNLKDYQEWVDYVESFDTVYSYTKFIYGGTL